MLFRFRFFLKLSDSNLVIHISAHAHVSLVRKKTATVTVPDQCQVPLSSRCSYFSLCVALTLHGGKLHKKIDRVFEAHVPSSQEIVNIY